MPLFQTEMKAAEEQREREREEEKRKAAERKKEEKRQEREVGCILYSMDAGKGMSENTGACPPMG